MTHGRLIDPWFLGLAGLGVAIRAAFLLLAGRLEPHADESSYLHLAVCWNHFGLFSDCGNFYWPPGYPFVLAAALRAFGGGVFAVKLLQVLAAGIEGYYTMRIAARAWDRRAGLVAGAIWCAYLPLIGYTHYLWPETLFLALFLPALDLLLRWWQAEPQARSGAGLLAAGLLMGLSLLVKESMFYLVPLWCLLMVRHCGRAWWPEGIRRAALFGLAAAAVLMPWTLRNYEVYGRVVTVAASLGDNCFRGVFRRYQNYEFPTDLVGRDDPGAARGEVVEDSVNFYVRLYGPDHWLYRTFIDRPPEAEWERVARPNVIDQSRANVRRAFDFMRAYPGYFAAGRVKRLANWVTPMSFFVRHFGLERYHGLLARPLVSHGLVVAALLMSLVVIAACLPGLLLLREPAARLMLFTTLGYALIPALLMGMSRHRAAVEPLLIAAAAGCLSRFGRPWSLRPAAIVLLGLGWALLAFLWYINAAEVLAVVKIIWSKAGG